MKSKKRIMTLMSVTLLACILCSCGKPEKKFIGTWTTSFDMVPLMEETMGEDFKGFESSPVIMYLTFEEDGTYQMYADQETALATIDEWKEAVIDFYVEKNYEQIKKDMNYTEEQIEDRYQKIFGCSCREYIETVALNIIDGKKEEMIESVGMSGAYRAEKDRLYLGRPEVRDDICDIYTMEKDTLTLKLPAEEAACEAALADWFTYPLVFTRVQE